MRLMEPILTIQSVQNKKTEQKETPQTDAPSDVTSQYGESVTLQYVIG